VFENISGILDDFYQSISYELNQPGCLNNYQKPKLRQTHQ